MIWLILSVLANSGLILMFRWFGLAGIHTRQAIMINYFVASTTGFLLFPPTLDILERPWLLPTAALGIFFYLIFRIMARTAQENGVAVSVVVSKMSVVIPVIVGITILNEDLTVLKIIGVVSGLISVLLTTQGGSKGGQWWLPVVLFLSTGLIDTSLKGLQVTLLPEGDFPLFSATIFFFAALASVTHHFFTKELRINQKTVRGGLLLGLINFGSLFFVLKSLALPGWESSVVFPINNFGIVLCATLLAIVLFRERPAKRVWFGLLLASGAIWMLYFSSPAV